MVRTFTDPDRYAEAVRAGTVSVTITQRGRFRAKICSVDFNDVWMQRLSDNLSRIGHTADLAGRAIVAFSTQPGPPVIRGGTELPWGSLSRLSTESRYQRSCGPTFFGGISLPVEMMASIGPVMVGKDLTPPRDDLTIQPTAEAMARLQRLHETSGHLAEAAPSVLAHPEAARGLKQALIEAMMHCLGDGETHEDRAASRQHAAIMRRFHRSIEEHLDDPLYIPELCKEIATSSRTLTTCCQEHLGMGPKRYLLLRRMKMVQRALRESFPGQTSVTEAAMQYGFWQLGRFAVEYKRLFGEAPSATLAQRV